MQSIRSYTVKTNSPTNPQPLPNLSSRAALKPHLNVHSMAGSLQANGQPESSQGAPGRHEAQTITFLYIPHTFLYVPCGPMGLGNIAIHTPYLLYRHPRTIQTPTAVRENTMVRDNRMYKQICTTYMYLSIYGHGP